MMDDSENQTTLFTFNSAPVLPLAANTNNDTTTTTGATGGSGNMAENFVVAETGNNGDDPSAEYSLFGIAVFKQQGKMHFIGKIVLWFMKAVSFATKFDEATRTGILQLAKTFAFGLTVAIVLSFLLHARSQRKIEAMKAEAEDREMCHVCMDTSKTPVPPCSMLTKYDFGQYSRKLDMLCMLMVDHINHDDEMCMASFHVGSGACAFAMKMKSFASPIASTQVFFNPIEVRGTWSNPPVAYLEGSDFYPGITLKRARPDSITISYTTASLKPEFTMANQTVTFYGEAAACACHALEVLNGTHAELYSDTKPKTVSA